MKRQGRYVGQAPGLEEGLRRPEEGREDDRVLRPGIGNMALKKFNPTSPGRRFMTALTFDEITKSTPEKSLTEPLKKTGGRDNRGPHHRPLHRRRPQAALPDRGLQARQDGRPGQGGGHRVRPQPLGPPGPAALRGRREALHPLAGRPGRGRHRGLRRGRGHPARQRAAPEGDPRRHHDPQHRAAPRQGRADGAHARAARPSWWPRKATTRRSSCPRARSARCTSTARPPSARSATSSTRTSRFGKAGRKRWLGTTPAQPRRGHEPRRPSARRRRRQDLRRPPSGDAVGQAHQGRQDAEQQAHPAVHRQEAEEDQWHAH